MDYNENASDARVLADHEKDRRTEFVPMHTFPNRNILWASLAVDEAVRQGVRAAVLVPGSRSTPLIWAWSRQNRVPVFTPWDERSAGYFALGLALGLEGPVAVVTTSGTAVANLYPAVLEAERSQVPLLLMTGDRPLELYDSGANQTVDQVKIFGDRVRWFAQVPLPEAHPPGRVLRALRTLMARAVARARGWDGPPGPVHLNFPFRKPLEPIPQPQDLSSENLQRLQREIEGKDGGPWTRLLSFRPAFPPEEARTWAEALAARPRGLIVCGPRCPGGAFPQRVVALAQALGYPLLADPLSGLRFGPWAASEEVLGAYPLALEAGWRPPSPPQVVLRFGAAPVGNGLLRALAQWEEALHLAVDPYGTWHDPEHRLDALFRVHPEDWVTQVLQALTQVDLQRDASWLQSWREMEKRVRETASRPEDVEGQALPRIVHALPEESILVVGNSLPVRHLEELAFPQSKFLQVWANRGTSGIDGVLSTAVGLAAARPERPLVAVLGDHSFLYDVNILALVRDLDLRLTLVVLHNDGGGIFYRLPIREFDPPFTPHVRHPHGLSFRGVAEMYGLCYQEVPVSALQERLQEALKAPMASLLVVPSDAHRHEDTRRRWLRALAP